jgi:hypothetical protein
LEAGTEDTDPSGRRADVSTVAPCCDWRRGHVTSPHGCTGQNSILNRVFMW